MEDGDTALMVLAHEAPVDLVLSDVIMPDNLDGPAPPRVAKNRYPGIKLPMMTGHMELRGGKSTGVDVTLDVIRKPFDNLVLAQKNCGVLEKWRSPRSCPTQFDSIWSHNALVSPGRPTGPQTFRSNAGN